MKQLAEFSLKDGTKFLVEVDEPDASAIERVALSSGKLVIQAKQSFEDILDKVKPVASTIITHLKELNNPADEVSVKFGLKLSTEAGVIFTSVGGEVTYEITLKWSAKKGS